MKKNKIIASAAAIIFVIFGVFMIGTTSVSAQEAPDFTLTDIEGNEVSLSDFKGKVIIIDFWATWCGPCKKAIPEVNRWAKKYKDKMVVIGLSDEPESKVRAMKNPVIGYYSAIDTKRRMKSALQISGIPHVIVIDPKGIVRWQGFPFLRGFELTDAVLEGLFKKYGN